MADQQRPTKKQHQLLVYIDTYIKEHGYSPSYREIMSGCGYTSIATVALHVNNLIHRGHLVKRGRSARSLEVVDSVDKPLFKSNEIKASDERWLIDKVEYYFGRVEQAQKPNQTELDQLYVLVGALKVLELEGAAQSFLPRLTTLKKRVQGE